MRQDARGRMPARRARGPWCLGAGPRRPERRRMWCWSSAMLARCEKKAKGANDLERLFGWQIVQHGFKIAAGCEILVAEETERVLSDVLDDVEYSRSAGAPCRRECGRADRCLRVAAGPCLRSRLLPGLRSASLASIDLFRPLAPAIQGPGDESLSRIRVWERIRLPLIHSPPRPSTL
jgi:hypothetical protein